MYTKDCVLFFCSSGATTDNLPPGVLYRVKATYKYNQEDVDELSFDVGEIVRVVEYEDPEEQVTILILSSALFVLSSYHKQSYIMFYRVCFICSCSYSYSYRAVA